MPSAAVQRWIHFAVMSAATAGALSSAACYPQGGFGSTPLYLGTPDFPYDVGPFLVQIRPGTMAVVLEHELSEPPTVSWSVVASSTTGRSSTASEQTTTAVLENGVWVAAMNDLPVGPQLQYHLTTSLGDHPPIRFRAGRPLGEKFRFAAFGDTRSGHKVHRSLIEAIAPRRYRLSHQ